MEAHGMRVDLVTNMNDPIRLIFLFYFTQKLERIRVSKWKVRIANYKDSAIAQSSPVCCALVREDGLHWGIPD